VNLNMVLADESGQGLGEYGLILALVAVVCAAVVVLVGANIQKTLSHVGSSI
jgi:Flp pilus assembly pilin Flp